MSTTTDKTVRELDRRSNHGIDVQLLWNVRTDRVYVTVQDERSGELLELEVAPADALAAFRHPYAYAASRRDIDHALVA